MHNAVDSVDCADWSDCGSRMGGCCGRGLYGGRPSRGVCRLVCQLGHVPAQGVAMPMRLGDRVARVAKRLGITSFVDHMWEQLRRCDVWSDNPAARHCGCEARRHWLNRFRWPIRQR